MPLIARDIHDQMRSVGTWVHWDERTNDGFKAGDPDAEVRGIAVGWQARQSAMEEALAKGCNLFITHEPTFYGRLNGDAPSVKSETDERKRAWLEGTGMVVYRCHDVWDLFPQIGITDAWSEFLDLGRPIRQVPFYNLHQVPVTTAWELAQRLEQRLSTLGHQAIQFFGVKWQMVHRLAVGTGAITDVREMVKLGADVVLATNDGGNIWRDAAWMEEMGLPLLVVDHMTSEIPGLRKLADYLRQRFPGVPIEFIGPTCSHEIYAVERYRDTGIRMRHDDIDDLPPVTLPEGYALRPMRADEPWAYLEVMNQSTYFGKCDQGWFDRTFAQDPAYDPSYLQIIWKGAKPVAAAAAWHWEVEGERWGLIHWVCVLSSERAKGLGKAITLSALHRLRARGFHRAMLNTGVWNLPAVATYLRLGFRPWPTASAPQSVWDAVLHNLAEWRQLPSPLGSQPR